MFGKKTTVEELIKLFSVLSNEEKQKFLGAVNGDGAADTTLAPTADGESNADTEARAEIGNEGESEERSEPSTEGKGEKGKNIPDAAEDATPAENSPTEDAPPMLDNQTADNTAEVLERLGTRLTAIEEAIKEFSELKELMQKFTQAQAEKFGYNGTIPGGKKDYGEMSANEMKTKILNGEI